MRVVVVMVVLVIGVGVVVVLLVEVAGLVNGTRSPKQNSDQTPPEAARQRRRQIQVSHHFGEDLL